MKNVSQYVKALNPEEYTVTNFGKITFSRNLKDILESTDGKRQLTALNKLRDIKKRK